MSSFVAVHRRSIFLEKLSLLILIIVAFQLLLIFNQPGTGSNIWLRSTFEKNIPDTSKKSGTASANSLSPVEAVMMYDDNRREILPSSIKKTGEDMTMIGSDKLGTSVQPTVTISRDNLIKIKGIRVACIIPYTGTSLPAWFDAFAFSAYSSAPLFDFLIFVTEIPLRSLPPNVKIIQITKNNLYERIARLDANEQTVEIFQNNLKSVRNLIEFFPYVLVEFKPCLGVLFSDYLEEYSHWGLADLDLLVGEMHKIITPTILNKYDIYT